MDALHHHTIALALDYLLLPPILAIPCTKGAGAGSLKPPHIDKQSAAETRSKC